MTANRAVIVGASHAGAQLAGNLRKEKWDGDILLIDDEGRLPYQRPPLSKAYLAGTSELDDFAIRGRQFYEQQSIELDAETVIAIDRDARSVTMGSGNVVTYSRLAICTGARARQLPVPGAELAGVHSLRTASDVEAIRAAAVQGRRVVGVEVTVLEAAARVLERVTAPVVSAFFDRIRLIVWSIGPAGARSGTCGSPIIESHWAMASSAFFRSW